MFAHLLLFLTLTLPTTSLAQPSEPKARFIVDGYIDGKDETKVHYVRGHNDPKRLRYLLFEYAGYRIFFFEYALPSVVAEAEKQGWLAEEWQIGPDSVTDLEPLSLPGIPFRPVGTFVRVRPREWEALDCEGYEARIQHVLRVLVPASAIDASLDSPLPTDVVARR